MQSLEKVSAAVIASVLLFASVQKLYATEGVPYLESLLGSFALPVVVCLEVAVSALLVFARVRWVWAAVAAMFGCFLAVNTMSALVGRDDCGCVGQFHVSSSAMLVFDAIAFAVACLFTCKGPRAVRHRGEGGMQNAGAAPMLGRSALLLTVLLASVVIADRTQKSLPGLVDHGTSVELLPEAWVGKRLPLLPYVEGRSLHGDSRLSLAGEMQVGEWLVVLHRDGCSDCTSFLDDVLSNPPAPPTRIAVIHLAGSPARMAGASGGTRVYHGRLTFSVPVFARGAVALGVVGGVVRAVDENSSPQFINFVKSGETEDEP